MTLRDLYQRESHDEMYIVMDFMDTDLHRVLQSDQRLSETHFQVRASAPATARSRR